MLIKFTYGTEKGFYQGRVDILSSLSYFSEGASLFHFEYVVTFRGNSAIILSFGVWKTKLGTFVQTLS